MAFPPTTLIDILPDPVLLHVLSYLSTPQLCRCARACRRWYNLAWDPRLWSTIRLTGELLNYFNSLYVAKIFDILHHYSLYIY
uniref:F-box domain-containing protein n=1 Tax=Cyprinus carpio TaxID=7962 RepID=A0A8C2GH55_CYPCA